jgi:hypothetical protein
MQQFHGLSFKQVTAFAALAAFFANGCILAL